MSEEFSIEIKLSQAVRVFFHSQLFRTPQLPTQLFSNQTIIVTGANIGLGLEAARHFYRLDCAKLILAVRTVSKGETAKEDILQTTNHRTDADAIEVWELNLASTTSTVAFAERINKELPRLDVLVENAGINSKTYSVSEEIEQTIQVNVVNTFLLALLLLPKLTETAKVANSPPHLTIVTSEAHHLNKFSQIKASHVYEALNDEKSYNGQSSYEISKLMQILLVRELVSRTKSRGSPSSSVTINLVNPGLCFSTLAIRNETPLVGRIIGSILYAMIARTTEVGSRTLVLGACAGPISHGKYMSDGQNSAAEPWVYTDVGSRVQEKVFEQTMKVLELRRPGIRNSVGF